MDTQDVETGVDDENERVEEKLAEEIDEEELRAKEHGIAELLTELHETDEVIL
uniref:Uncharacterized protein n=1 Tax=Solanum tuberosum TaxID=4113 RepID=M1DXM7_SOLTU